MTIPQNYVLKIKVINEGQESAEVSGAYVSFAYVHPLIETLFGRGTVELPLKELTEGPYPPCALDVGESIRWTADLHQLNDLLERKGLTLSPHPRYLGLRDIDIERWMRRGHLAIAFRNVIARLSVRHLAVIIRDNYNKRYKTKVKWEPPKNIPQSYLRHPGV